MVSERTTPLRERMIEDMRIRGLGGKSRQAHIRALKGFAGFPGHSTDTTTPEDLRAYQLHMTNTEATPSDYNACITALRFIFSMTCGREKMKKYMQFRTEQRKLPAVLSIEEVSELLAVTPGPGLIYRAALSISYGAGLQASEVCNLTTGDINSDRMLIQVVQGSVLHTWASALTHHPHIHMIVPGGGLSPGGSRWVGCKPGFFLHVRVLSRLFRRLFIEGLMALHRAGQRSPARSSRNV